MAVTAPITAVEEQSSAASAAAAFDAEALLARRRHWWTHPVLLYSLRRIGLYLITLWGSITAAFFFFHLIPGNPIDALILSLQQQGRYTSQGNSDQLVSYYKEAFGLNGTLWDQYTHYLRQLLVAHQFGPSLLNFPTDASVIILRALPWTLGLLGLSTLVGWGAGVLLGTAVGWLRGSFLGDAVTDVALFFSHIPYYFLALYLLFFLGYRLALLPPNNAYDPSIAPGFTPAYVGSVLSHAALPALSVVFIAVCNWTLGTRMLVVAMLGEDFLNFAEAKGLPTRRILSRYVLRNAWLPQLTALSISLGLVFNGQVLLEQLFRYPGLGWLFVQAQAILDYDTMQGIVFITIFLVLTLLLVIDLLLPLFDPRVKLVR
jgi:peptide/nickel transport system permease protein